MGWGVGEFFWGVDGGSFLKCGGEEEGMREGYGVLYILKYYRGGGVSRGR